MQEMLDIVNEKNKVVGKEARETCHRQFLPHRLIHVFVFDRKGRVFVAKRSKRKATYPWLLDVSAAGHVDSGETYKQAALRELFEELGIKPRKIRKLFTFRLKSRPENAFVTQYSAEIERAGKLNKYEIENGKFMEWKEMRRMARKNPRKFAPTSITALKVYKK